MTEKGERKRTDMKNKIKERILCLMLGVGVAAAVGVTGCGKSDASSDSEETAKTEGMQETADTKEESEPSENTKKRDSEEKDKTETVYVKSDAKGNPREITVQTKLKNTGDGDTIKDYTNLTDIKNKEGDEAFTQNADGTVEWENHGEDITYEGTGSAELPVDVSISYELDGQAIEPEELAQNDIDLIISTVRLDTTYRYIYVSPLLNRQDRMLLDSKFQLILSQKSDRRPHAEKKVPETSFTRKDIHFVSRTGVEIEYLLDHIRIGRAPVLQERQEILAYAASLFSDTPEMESHFYEILKKRDQIADTYMKPFHALLLHGKSPDIMHPCFGYVHLEPPIYENARIILGAIVTFIPENDPDQVSAPIVSEIIGSLMEQPELLKALREDDDERFTLLLETSLMKFYKETAADRLKLSAQDK